MTKQAPEIEIPRLPGERAERYRARVEYIVAGADRSLDQLSRKLTVSSRLIKRWSVADGWVALAADYDRTVYTLAARRAADDYSESLAAHRKRATDAAAGLYGVAERLLTRLDKELDKVELNAYALTLIRSAFQTALDLEAHALGIDLLVSRIEGQDDQEQL